MDKSKKQTATHKAATSVVGSGGGVRKTPKNQPKGNSILTKFNEIGSFKFLNLTSMKKNHGYVITHLTKYNSKFGERLLADLDGEAKLFLPERYNTFTDQQIAELGSGVYKLINRGKTGDIYNLELTKNQNKRPYKKQESRPPPPPQDEVAEAVASISNNTNDVDRLENYTHNNGDNDEDEDEDIQFSQAFPTNIGYYSPL